MQATARNPEVRRGNLITQYGRGNWTFDVGKLSGGVEETIQSWLRPEQGWQVEGFQGTQINLFTKLRVGLRAERPPIKPRGLLVIVYSPSVDLNQILRQDAFPQKPKLVKPEQASWEGIIGTPWTMRYIDLGPQTIGPFKAIGWSHEDWDNLQSRFAVAGVKLRPFLLHYRYHHPDYTFPTKRAEAEDPARVIVDITLADVYQAMLIATGEAQIGRLTEERDLANKQLKELRRSKKKKSTPGTEALLNRLHSLPNTFERT